eukprot:4011906-Prorocentrum_lima.AAC.1
MHGSLTHGVDPHSPSKTGRARVVNPRNPRHVGPRVIGPTQSSSPKKDSSRDGGGAEEECDDAAS